MELDKTFEGNNSQKSFKCSINFHPQLIDIKSLPRLPRILTFDFYRNALENSSTSQYKPAIDKCLFLYKYRLTDLFSAYYRFSDRMKINDLKMATPIEEKMDQNLKVSFCVSI